MDLDTAIQNATRIINQSSNTNFKNVISITSLVIRIIEEVAKTVQAAGVKVSSEDKLKLAFDLTDKVVTILQDKGYISAELAQEVIRYSQDSEAYTDLIASLVSIIKQYGPVMIAKIKKCCC